LAVSRKVSRKAVVRNRIKRQIRETFRQNKETLKGIDCVVVAKHAAESASKPLLFSTLKSHWRKISDDG
jgi:ribonuclease P protein component